jgi:putative transposase
MIELKGSHSEREVILWGVRWYVAYRSAILKQQSRVRTSKRPVGSSWRMDEINGAWKYLYRAVDKAAATVDFLFTVKRDREDARHFLRRAIGQNGVSDKIMIDKSDANGSDRKLQQGSCGWHRDP